MPGRVAHRSVAGVARSPSHPSAAPQLKLQGQYMGYMRQLKPRQKARVKAAKAKGGYKAGIGLAKRLAAGS